jgi:hypothetical protein
VWLGTDGLAGLVGHGVGSSRSVVCVISQLDRFSGGLATGRNSLNCARKNVESEIGRYLSEVMGGRTVPLIICAIIFGLDGSITGAVGRA